MYPEIIYLFPRKVGRVLANTLYSFHVFSYAKVLLRIKHTHRQPLSSMLTDTDYKATIIPIQGAKITWPPNANEGGDGSSSISHKLYGGTREMLRFLIRPTRLIHSSPLRSPFSAAPCSLLNDSAPSTLPPPPPKRTALAHSFLILPTVIPTNPDTTEPNFFFIALVPFNSGIGLRRLCE